MYDGMFITKTVTFVAGPLVMLFMLWLDPLVYGFIETMLYVGSTDTHFDSGIYDSAKFFFETWWFSLKWSYEDSWDLYIGNIIDGDWPSITFGMYTCLHEAYNQVGKLRNTTVK